MMDMLLHIMSIGFYWAAVQTCDGSEDAAAYLPGDIVIGGLFPIHNRVKNLLEKTENSSFLCDSLHVQSMIEALSMTYAIEKINNSTLLQGIQLGYEIHDSCSYTLKAIESTIKFISDTAIVQNSTNCNCRKNIGPMKAVVGGIYSEISIAVSRILGLYLIPQISPSSSAPILSDKVSFPSFLRTVPSDTHQMNAMVELIKTFQWNWVGIISSDDDYGRSAQGILNRLFKAERICIAFSKTVPSYVDHPLLQASLENVLTDMSGSSTNVLIVVAKDPIVTKLIKECIKRNISKIWIASDGWSSAIEVLNIKNIEMAGTFLGLSFKMGYIMGFEDYLRKLQPPDHETINFLEEYKELRYECTEDYREYLQCVNSSSENCVFDSSLELKSSLACQMDNISFVNDDYLVKNIGWSRAYSTHLAIMAIASALNRMLCTNGVCEKKFHFSPRKLLEELQSMTFSFDGETFNFDSSGDVSIGYDVITWHVMNTTNTIKIIGKYEISESKISINRSLLHWNTKNNQVPFSNCSKSCTPGYYRKYSFISCCYACVPCPKDDYSPIADATECLKCPSWQWSTNGSDRCANRTIEYFDWKDPYAITLLIFLAIGFLLLIMTAALFLKHFDTPAVKAAGGHYTFILMVSLLISLVSIGLFIGEPNDILCVVRQPLFGISFTISVSCILIKSIRILLAFESAKRGKVVVKLKYVPGVLIIALSSVQVLICTIWLLMNRPYREYYTVNDLLIIQCNEGSYEAFGIMLGYIGLLALICFLLAYKGRKLPEKYNEARCITFSMLVYMFVWILFIPIYINTRSGIYLSVVEAVAILASIYGVISCHLLPGCYILLFKRETCTREKYLQSTFLSFYRDQKKVQSFCKPKVNLEVPAAALKPNFIATRVPQVKVTLGSPAGRRRRHNSY
ncbi:G-protein coupled receptor family C group 6 member A-like isoform X2 [Eleutherodactylus coqui]|uniref:G-protein coupled receptor family C group 6 member A-like isoform X2 n=1 Tax=Eleutherodactylus coqui TaxID=57060 RepID=UPI0034621C7C